MVNDPRVGTSIGGYLVEAVIGRGGMGVVYRARTALGDAIALKVIAPELMASEEMRGRFEREAALVSGLDHPNILPILAAGESDGVVFLAMPYVPGPNLKSILADGPLESRRAVALLSQVARALDAAHETGLVHRDVKPQNILVQPATGPGKKEHAWLTDFGLVRQMSAGGGTTRTGEFLGSVEYVAPEQIAGHVVDGRADVYSLGCVLFECLTGTVPFAREMHVAALWAHMHERAPRVTDLRPDLPRGLDEILATALSKDRESRYLTCGELTEEVKKELRSGPMATARTSVAAKIQSEWDRPPQAKEPMPRLPRATSQPQRPRPQRAFAFGAAAIALLIGVALGRDDVRDAVGRAATLVEEVGAAAIGGGSAPDSTGARQDDTRRDGRGDDTNLDRGSLDGGTDPAVPLVPRDRRSRGMGSGGAPYPSAPAPMAIRGGAPASAKIVWVAATEGDASKTDLWLMNADGSGKRPLTQTPADEHFPSWSPDGRRILFAREGDIWTIAPDGSGERRLIDCGGEGEDEVCSDPALSPDGELVAFIRRGSTTSLSDRGYAAGDIYLATARGHELRLLKWGSFGSPSFSPDGRRLIAASGGRLHVISLETSRTQEVELDGRALNPAWSPTGNRLALEYVPSGSRAEQVHVTELRRPQPRRLALGIIGSFDPAWSPDGDSLVFSSWHRAPGGGDIYVVGRDGKGLRQLTSTVNVSDIQPSWWSPPPRPRAP